jgi:hypothetical protein
VNINAAAPNGGKAGQPFYQLYGNASVISDMLPIDQSKDNSLQMRATHRVHDANFGVAYTFSKAMDATDNDEGSALTWNWAPIQCSRELPDCQSGSPYGRHFLADTGRDSLISIRLPLPPSLRPRSETPAAIFCFKLKERYTLQFRAEALGLTNTPIFANPAATVGNSALGIVSSATGDRQIRIALKLIF